MGNHGTVPSDSAFSKLTVAMKKNILSFQCISILVKGFTIPVLCKTYSGKYTTVHQALIDKGCNVAVGVEC